MIEPITRDGAGSSRAWPVRDFRSLWRASTASTFGSEIGELALPLLAIVTLSATPAEVGLLRTAQFAPFLLATLPLGVLVERRRKRPLMLTADIARFVLIGAIPLIVWTELGGFGLIVGLVFAAGVFTALYQLADFAYLPLLLPEERIVDANGKLAASSSANAIAGKGVGGLIVEALTAPIAVLADAFTYLISAWNLHRIDHAEVAPAVAADQQPLRDAWRGVAATIRHPIIRPLVAEATIYNFSNEMFILALLLHAVRNLHLSAGAIGVVFVAGGVGSFAGAWFGLRLTGRFGYGRVLLTTLIVGNGAPIVVIRLSEQPAIALAMLIAIFVAMGLGSGIANVHAVSLRQTAVAPALRSRMNAGYRMISWGAIPLGAGIGGALAGQIGIEPTMQIGAIGVALATAPIALSPIPRLATITDAVERST